MFGKGQILNSRVKHDQKKYFRNKKILYKCNKCVLFPIDKYHRYSP
jgi:hypothetical protein